MNRWEAALGRAGEWWSPPPSGGGARGCSRAVPAAASGQVPSEGAVQQVQPPAARRALKPRRCRSALILAENK